MTINRIRLPAITRRVGWPDSLILVPGLKLNLPRFYSKPDPNLNHFGRDYVYPALAWNESRFLFFATAMHLDMVVDVFLLQQLLHRVDEIA